MPALLQCAHHLPFLNGGHPPENRIRFEDLAHFVEVRWQFTSVIARAVEDQAHLPGDRGGGVRVVAGDHPQRNALLAKIGDSVGRIRPDLLGEGDERNRLQHPGQPVSGYLRLRQLLIAVSEYERAKPELDEAFVFPLYGGIHVAARENNFRRSQYPGADRGAIGDTQRAPLAV